MGILRGVLIVVLLVFAVSPVWALEVEYLAPNASVLVLADFIQPNWLGGTTELGGRNVLEWRNSAPHAPDNDWTHEGVHDYWLAGVWGDGVVLWTPGSYAETITTIESRAVAFALGADWNDGRGELYVDDALVARLNLATTDVTNFLLLVDFLRLDTHALRFHCIEMGPQSLSAEVFTYGGAALDSSYSDLSVTKAASRSPVRAGSNITYTIEITNDGPDDATDVLLTDNLPDETMFVSCHATGDGVPGGSGNNRTVTYASLAVGQTETITLVTKVKAPIGQGTLITNAATVESATPDPYPEHNWATATVTSSSSGSHGLLVSADLVAGDPFPEPGDRGPWTFQITLQACDTVYAISARASVWHMVERASDTGHVMVFPFTGVNWRVAGLAPGESATLLVTVDPRISSRPGRGRALRLSSQWTVRYIQAGAVRKSSNCPPVLLHPTNPFGW